MAPAPTRAGRPPADDRGDARAPAATPSSWRTRLLSALGLALLLGMVAAVWMLGYWEPRLLPIRVIEVQGELHHHSSQLLERTIGERLRGGILTADLAALKAAAEQLPWVGRASLRRVWPDTLQVRIEEHRPIARWNADGLVTAEGVVFHPDSSSFPPGLPLLEGDDKRAPEVARRYLEWRERLATVAHLIETLSVDARGDWRVRLVNGIELRLGTGPVEERLARFIETVQQIEAAGRPLMVDMRYSNGFAVKWAPNADPPVRANSDRAKRPGNRG